MGFDILKNIFDLLVRTSPNIKRKLWMAWYNYLVKMHKGDELLFMNYGYADLEPEARLLSLQPSDEKYRYCIQLYHHVVQGVDITNKDVLEVGSGRGGGAAYIAKKFAPASMIGLDFAQNAIDFCKSYHASVKNLLFFHGDAEDMPFEENSFDIVVNVESSHSYGTSERFFQEVHRVLRPKGYFLITDFRDKKDIARWYEEVRNSGLTILQEEEITPNIVRALE